MQFVKIRFKGTTQDDIRNIRCPHPELRVLKILEGTEGLTGFQISIASGGTISKARANKLVERLKERRLVESIPKYVEAKNFPIKRLVHVPTFESLEH